MKPLTLKIFGIVVVAILILNMILFALQKIDVFVFWGVIIVGAVLVYWVLPRLKK